MGQSLSKVYVHITFSTNHRLNLIDDSIGNKLFTLVWITLIAFFPGLSISQSTPKLAMTCGELTAEVIIDGILDEEDWKSTEPINHLLTIEPIDGGEPTSKTEIRVLADSRFLVIGIRCYDNEPEKIISYSKLRDADLTNEDHIRLVIDPFLDGQSGYIFGVNANGARYDALVSNRGESENSNWDAIWEAAPQIDSLGWSLEILIPIQSISFKKGLKKWGFNVERRIQRNQETIRWANARRDQWFIQTSRAGLLINLPEFNYGLGMNIRPSMIAKVTNEGAVGDSHTSFSPSLDVSKRLSPNVLATVTVNTDFAEAEVDTRQTNLTRFPLFFPEKRAFFLEGSDIFEFGFGLSDNIKPFFSRRIGLYNGNEVPILAGGKLNGRIGKTSFGGMVLRADELEDEMLDGSTMGVVRLKQNVLKESSIGFIGTFGDPQSRGDNWTSGVDFTYQTTQFQGNKNFLVGVSGMVANQIDLEGDQSALAIKVDYPNDLWDVALTYFRIGDAFDPALGFVPRKGIQSHRIGITYAPRPSWKWLRQNRLQLFMTYVSDLDNNWESYRIFTAPINMRLESGDRFEFNYVPTGEHLTTPFEIVDEVVIPIGEYHFSRFRLETTLAAKRKFNGQISWWFGTFYSGTLDEVEAKINWNPTKLLTFEFTGTRNIGHLPNGDFDQTLLGMRARLNVTPNLQLNSFVQYDTETKGLGINARLHWIFNPHGDIFLVYNYNSINRLENWELINKQILLKARYNFRM